MDLGSPVSVLLSYISILLGYEVRLSIIPPTSLSCHHHLELYQTWQDSGYTGVTIGMTRNPQKQILRWWSLEPGKYQEADSFQLRATSSRIKLMRRHEPGSSTLEASKLGLQLTESFRSMPARQRLDNGRLPLR